MSTISASTLTTTALQLTADTTGALVFKTGATPTTALTLAADQSATFAGTVNFGTAGFTNLSISGVASFALGSVSAPSITFTGDTNTGIYSPGADTIAFVEGGTEAMRIDSSGNLLLGTTIGFTSTTLAGAFKMDGYGVYPYLNTTGNTNTGVLSGLTYQNSTPYSGDNGATSTTLVAALVQARISNSGAGGSNSINIQAGNFGTVVTNVASTARIGLTGLTGAAVRNTTTDVSTNVNNSLTGVSGTAVHGNNAGAGIVSDSAIAGSFAGNNTNGTVTTLEGVRAAVNIANATSSLSSSTTNATAVRAIMAVGAASGGPGTVTNLFGITTQGPTIGATGTVTNYYGLYLDTPSVTGTLTNRYGVWQNDASSINYFAGNVGIGTSTINGQSRVAIAGASTITDARGILSVNSTNAAAANLGGSISFGGENGQATTPYVFGAVSGRYEGSGYSGYLQLSTTNSGGTVTERMRIDSSGNVGINYTAMSSLGAKLYVYGYSGFGASANGGVSLGSRTNWTSTFENNAGSYGLGINVNSSTGIVNIQSQRFDGTATAYDIALNPLGGNLLVGKTAESLSTSGFGVNFTSGVLNGVSIVKNAGSYGTALWVNRLSGIGTGTLIELAYNSATVGTITTNGSTTAYNTSSDYRLKEDIAPMTGALNTVAKLKPVTYKWKADGSKGQGFIAHELAKVVPDCVYGEKDAIDEEGKPKYQGIDVSFLVATLTAAIQELKAEFDEYKASHP
jgi:hypothetical protein